MHQSLARCQQKYAAQVSSSASSRTGISGNTPGTDRYQSGIANTIQQIVAAYIRFERNMLFFPQSSPNQLPACFHRRKYADCESPSWHFMDGS